MTNTKDEALKLALEFIEANTYGGDDVVQLITAIREALAEQPAQEQEPVAFLANGTRFKMSFFYGEDNDYGNIGTYVTCFEAFEKELDGRWVALVPAEDDCHLKLTSPPASKPWVGLTDEERNAIERKHGLRYFDEVFHDIEAKLREKNA